MPRRPWPKCRVWVEISVSLAAQMNERAAWQRQDSLAPPLLVRTDVEHHSLQMVHHQKYVNARYGMFRLPEPSKREEKKTDIHIYKRIYLDDIINFGGTTSP